MKINKDTNTEQAILNAAERLFLEKGFAMTSTTEIAKEVGCNQALVHYYFRTKDKLFDAIFEKKFKIFVSSLLQSSNENASFEEKLKRKIEIHFDMLRANAKMPFLFFNELITNPNRLNSLKEKIQDLPKLVFQQLEKELQEEIQKGNIRPVTVFDILLTIASLNVFLFLGSPIFKTITGISNEAYEAMIERRKQEHVHIILSSLKP